MRRYHTLIVMALLVVAGLGCSDNPAVRARYQAEKMYFLAEKASRSAGIRPELRSPEVSGQLKDKYGATLQFCYAALDSFSVQQYPKEHSELSGIAFRAATRLSQIHYSEKEYDQSAHLLGDLLRKTHLVGAAEISAYLNLGRALQQNGQWDSALTVYRSAVQNFYPPLEPGGSIVFELLNLPSRIAGIYHQLGDETEAGRSLTEALEYYHKLARDFAGQPMATASHRHLANLYELAGQWENAVEELSRITNRKGQTDVLAAIRKADIFAGPLKKPKLALREYDSLFEAMVGADTLEKPTVLYKKGLLLLDRNKPAEAREIFNRVKNEFDYYYYGNPGVQEGIARSFEAQGNWGRAETEYRFLMDHFVGSHQSLQAYLYLADKYDQAGRKLEAERLRRQAKEEYERIAAEHRGNPGEEIALTYEAELFRRQGDWPSAAAILVSIFDKFPQDQAGSESLLAAAEIYRDKLGRPATADSLLVELKKHLNAVDGSDEI